MLTVWRTVPFLLIFAANSLIGIDEQSLWLDEAGTAYAAMQPNLIAAANGDPTNPPLYYMLLHLSTQLTGDSPLALRWFAFCMGVMALALTIRLADRRYGHRAALYSAALGAFSAPLVWGSQEVRMYTFMALLVVAAAGAWEQLRTAPTRRAWLILLGAELAALYAHNSAPVIVLWLNGVTVLAWLILPRTRTIPVRGWIAGQVIVGALWFPYFVTRFLLVTDANSALVRSPAFDFALWAGYWIAPWEMVGDRVVFGVWAGMVLLITVIFARKRDFLIAHWLLITLGLWLALRVLGNEMHGRYLVMAVPLLLIISGSALANAPRTLAPLLVIGIVGGSQWVTITARSDPAYHRDDARGIVQHYADTLTSADSVLMWSYADRFDLAYYWDRLGVSAERIVLPEGTDWDGVRPLLPESGTVALNVWYTQRADYRGMLGCALGHGTTAGPIRTEFSGLANLTYPQRAVPLPEAISQRGVSVVAALTQVGAIPSDFTADQALCVPITVDFSGFIGETSGELKAALIVKNPLGDEIARADAILATANQRTSIDNTRGEALTGYPLIRLPYGAPPVTYTLHLRLYDDGNLSGYDWLYGGSPAGKDWQIGVWTPVLGADWTPPESDAGLLDGDGDQVQTVTNGETVAVTLLWHTSDPLPDATLAADDGGWSIPVPPLISEHDPITLDWRRVRVPLDAPAGDAALRLADGTVIGRYRVEPLRAVTEPPPVEHGLAMRFADIGTLIGYSIGEPTGEGYPVTLVWEAAGATAVPYTVFVQLLDADGQLVAQSDSQPAGGSRPTTGWRGGEYISDRHIVRYNGDAPEGDLTLIAGLYDPDGMRVMLGEGLDYVVLGVIGG